MAATTAVPTSNSSKKPLPKPSRAEQVDPRVERFDVREGGLAPFLPTGVSLAPSPCGVTSKPIQEDFKHGRNHCSPGQRTARAHRPRHDGLQEGPAAAGGDIEKAIDDMRAAGAIKAAKKAGNVAAEGSIAVKVADDHKAAVIIEVIPRPISGSAGRLQGLRRRQPGQGLRREDERCRSADRRSGSRP